ncbi:hypothetical protein ACN469_30425 [Corallococcus terminator]
MHSFIPVCLMVLAVLLTGFTGCGQMFALDCADTNCSDYSSRSAAQQDYEADPECRADLDADKDGLACEEDGNDVHQCPTTSSCGCSGKNKDACFADRCCLWVVGWGCGCR